MCWHQMSKTENTSKLQNKSLVESWIYIYIYMKLVFVLKYFLQSILISPFQHICSIIYVYRIYVEMRGQRHLIATEKKDGDLSRDE